MYYKISIILSLILTLTPLAFSDQEERLENYYKKEYNYRSYPIFSSHARERMVEKKITEKMVLETYYNGEINYKKSDLNYYNYHKNMRCARYAVEKSFFTFPDLFKNVRIIVEVCPNESTPEIVSAIDTTDTDYPLIYKIRLLVEKILENPKKYLIITFLTFLFLSLFKKKEEKK